MSSLGQELKKARESRNISIEEMASSTKIVGRHIAAIEEDRLGDMPAGFFMRGIIRSYANYIGLDADEILSRYEEEGLLRKQPKNSASTTEFVPSLLEKNRSIVRIILVIGIVVVIISLMFLWRSRRPKPPAAKPQATAVVPQIQPSSPPPAPKPAAAGAQQEWKGVTIEISFQDLTWIQVFADNELKINGLYLAGQTAMVQADKELLVNTGNAGGMTFLLNGKPAKILGHSAEVIKDIRITPDNIKDFLQDKEPQRPSN